MRQRLFAAATAFAAAWLVVAPNAHAETYEQCLARCQTQFESCMAAGGLACGLHKKKCFERCPPQYQMVPPKKGPVEKYRPLY